MADISLTIDTSEAQAAIEGLQAQADKLLATLEKCRDCTKECGVAIDMKVVGKDLVAALRGADYRELRTH